MANNISQLSPVISDTLIASVDIAEGTGVIKNSNGLAAYGAVGVSLFGVALRSAKAGEPVECVRLGLVKIKVATAASFVGGDKIAVVATTGQFKEAATTNVSQGILDPAEPAPGANGDFARAYVNVFTPETIS